MSRSGFGRWIGRLMLLALSGGALSLVVSGALPGAAGARARHHRHHRLHHSTLIKVQESGGVWTLPPGASVTFTHMSISGCDADYIFVTSTVTLGPLGVGTLGNNSASPCVNDALPNVTITNPNSWTDSFYVWLDDTSQPCITNSLGVGAAASAHKVSLNDLCSTTTPKLGQGNFNASLKFS